MKKRIIGLLAILTFMFAIPMIANAAIVDSGECGKDGGNVTWTLDDAGTLTISGTGEMKNYRPSAQPWYKKMLK